MIYFISDLHLFHKNVIQHSNRPFISVEEMNQTIIDNWNATINKEDEVYILGDFIVRGTGQQANQILKQLNGKKYLIKGNHDHFLDDKEFDITLFEWVKNYYTFRYNKIKFVLFHYPILEWDGYYNNSIHLYGHVHNNNCDYYSKVLGPRAINVSVEMLNYFPISIDKIMKRVMEE